jgi:hypothetical protein
VSSHDAVDDLFDFLQNKTIQNIGADFYDDKHYLVILLSDGSVAYISSNSSFYIAVEKHLIN